MKRREFIAGAISMVAVPPLAAQPVVNSRRLAIFSVFESTTLMNERSENRYYRVLFAELRRLGHIEGQNLTVERYGREQGTTGVAALVAQVVSTNPDVVYVIGPGAPFFKRETSTIPIVAMSADPVAQGLIGNLARPGGNITGVSVDVSPTIYGKRLELLREMFPAMSKIACVAPRIQWEAAQGAPMLAAAKTAGIPLVTSLVETPSSGTAYRDAIAQASREGANAIMILDSADAMTNRALIADLVGDARVPAIYPFFEFVEAGGLMAYSYDLADLNKRAANNINAILRGAYPGDIPFYQNTKFELSINLKTAGMLGLAVPAILLATAEKVVE